MRLRPPSIASPPRIAEPSSQAGQPGDPASAHTARGGAVVVVRSQISHSNLYSTAHTYARTYVQFAQSSHPFHTSAFQTPNQAPKLRTQRAPSTQNHPNPTQPSPQLTPAGRHNQTTERNATQATVRTHARAHPVQRSATTTCRPQPRALARAQGIRYGCFSPGVSLALNRPRHILGRASTTVFTVCERIRARAVVLGWGRSELTYRSSAR